MSNSIKINYEKFNIVQIGAGGTGANLDFFLSRLIWSLNKTGQKKIQFTVVDADTVEEKNIFRQPFIEAELGKNKAEIMARRYGSALGLEIFFKRQQITDKKSLMDLLTYEDYIPILIGCVDNDKSRCIFHDVFEDKKVKNMIWIDSGNEQTSGQVVLGIKGNGNVLLPPVTYLYPNILRNPGEFNNPESCSKIDVTDVTKLSQFLSTNATAAVVVLNFLTVILLGYEIKTNEVNFNILANHIKPTYIDYSSMFDEAI
ncbi:MAG: ThiF family adenylyltransferase [Clostridia bacterium]